MDLTKYIAKKTDEYVEKVINLARNEEELKILHSIIRLKMMNTELADSVKFTKNIENAYIDIIQKKMSNTN